ncbi:unnamed protein product [Schistocephalus solidus]|uniref:Uncharacterized protein n=1 Tax=Schistocephalus solidus TaxID=70667 RepID=A0A183T8H1_SCHSO|nr:unnamed protein product [Schistocephalus solidus]
MKPHFRISINISWDSSSTEPALISDGPDNSLRSNKFAGAVDDDEEGEDEEEEEKGEKSNSSLASYAFSPNATGVMVFYIGGGVICELSPNVAPGEAVMTR